MNGFLPYTLRIILAIFAVYRTAQFLPYDSGPFDIFKRVRVAVGKAAAKDNAKQHSFYKSLAELVNCPFCQGVYWAAIAAIFIIHPSAVGDTLILIFGIAGGQVALQYISAKSSE